MLPTVSWVSVCVTNGFRAVLPMGSRLCCQRLLGYLPMFPTVCGLCCQWVPIYVTNGFRAKLILLIAMSCSLPMSDEVAQWKARFPSMSPTVSWVSAYVTNGFRAMLPMGSHLCYQLFLGFLSMLPTVSGLCCQWVPISVTNGFRAKLILLIAMSYSLPMSD